MTRSDAFVTVSCEGQRCPATIDIGLTALAGGGYDERNVADELRAAGWRKDGDGSDRCPDCAEEEKGHNQWARSPSST